MSGLLSGPDQSWMLKWDVYCEHSLQVSDRNSAPGSRRSQAEREHHAKEPT